MYDGLRQLMEGRPLDVEMLRRNGVPRPMVAMLLAQEDLLGNETKHRAVLDAVTSEYPLERPYCTLVDLYERNGPATEVGAAMYHGLGWLYPDEPWVKDAVRDWRARVPSPMLPSPDAVLAEVAAISSGKPIPHSWRVASAVCTLLTEDRQDDAIRLAEQFRGLRLPDWRMRALAHMLYRRAIAGATDAADVGEPMN